MSAELTLTINGEVTRMRLLPDDTVVVSCDHKLTMDDATRVKEHVKGIFPDHEVLVLSEGFALSIAGPDEGPDDEGLIGIEVE